MSRASDPTPVYAWYIKGLGGMVNSLEQLQQENIQISEHWYHELRAYLDRLEITCDLLRKQGGLS